MTGHWSARHGTCNSSTNRAAALRRLDRPHEALISAHRARSISNRISRHARFVESVARLTLGDFAAGWRGYESRWQVGWLASQRRSFACAIVARRGIARRQDHSASRRAGPWRHHPVRALCDRFWRRAARNVILEVQRPLVRLLSRLQGARRSSSRAGRAAALRFSLSAAQPAAWLAAPRWRRYRP